MLRSSYKLPTFFKVNSILPFKGATFPRLKTLLSKTFFKKKPDYFINRVNSPIFSSLIGKRVLVYSGNTLTSFSVKRSMVGLSFKNFIRTKRTGASIHTEKRSKKKVK